MSTTRTQRSSPRSSKACVTSVPTLASSTSPPCTTSRRAPCSAASGATWASGPSGPSSAYVSTKQPNSSPQRVPLHGPSSHSTSATTTTPTSSATSGSSSDAHPPNTPPKRPGRARTNCLWLDAAVSRRAALEPAPEPAGEASPVCVATNVSVSAVQRVDAGRNEPEHRGKRRRTRCCAVEDEDREDRKHRDQRKADASPASRRHGKSLRAPGRGDHPAALLLPLAGATARATVRLLPCKSARGASQIERMEP